MSTPSEPRPPHDGQALEPIRVLRPRRTDALAELMREFQEQTSRDAAARQETAADLDAHGPDHEPGSQEPDHGPGAHGPDHEPGSQEPDHEPGGYGSVRDRGRRESGGPSGGYGAGREPGGFGSGRGPGGGSVRDRDRQGSGGPSGGYGAVREPLDVGGYRSGRESGRRSAGRGLGGFGSGRGPRGDEAGRDSGGQEAGHDRGGHRAARLPDGYESVAPAGAVARSEAATEELPSVGRESGRRAVRAAPAGAGLRRAAVAVAVLAAAVVGFGGALLLRGEHQGDRAAPAPAPPRATPSTPAPTAPEDPDGAGTLREGATGPEVTELQQRLLDIPDVYRDGSTSGSYDPTLTAAVARFQLWYGIRGDETGVYGNDTRAALESRTS
ncbi:peptidoglycan-binding protein [Streptomyces sp. NPDC007984]|uniref:peptidoglycan-binding domain-containing protein n=1 Tax=Streptomyces sp. NPDC007984 TaxID=3364801 RepID=UPI0036E3E27F